MKNPDFSSIKIKPKVRRPHNKSNKLEFELLDANGNKIKPIDSNIELKVKQREKEVLRILDKFRRQLEQKSKSQNGNLNIKQLNEEYLHMLKDLGAPDGIATKTFEVSFILVLITFEYQIQKDPNLFLQFQYLYNEKNIPIFFNTNSSDE